MNDQPASSLRRRTGSTQQDDAVPEPQPVPELGGEQASRSSRSTGRTPSGSCFSIPQTHNVLSGLFDPRLPKSHIDWITLFLLATQCLLFILLDRRTSRWFFLGYFALWRLSYNLGLGLVLRAQSETRWIVRTVSSAGWFDLERRPRIARWIRHQLVQKMGDDYSFETLPLEFNVWILFRHCVDVILLNDFLAYSLFGLTFFSWSELSLVRSAAGIGLIVFNVWVKVDAHRIIKDFAWYWGDAFFMSMDELVFDSIFECCPHPVSHPASFAARATQSPRLG